MASFMKFLAGNAVFGLIKLFFSKLLSGLFKYLITERFAVGVFLDVLEHIAKKTSNNLDDSVVARIRAELSEFEHSKENTVVK